MNRKDVFAIMGVVCLIIILTAEAYYRPDASEGDDVYLVTIQELKDNNVEWEGKQVEVTGNITRIPYSTFSYWPKPKKSPYYLMDNDGVHIQLYSTEVDLSSFWIYNESDGIKWIIGFNESMPWTITCRGIWKSVLVGILDQPKEPSYYLEVERYY